MFKNKMEHTNMHTTLTKHTHTQLEDFSYRGEYLEQVEPKKHGLSRHTDNTLLIVPHVGSTFFYQYNCRSDRHRQSNMYAEDRPVFGTVRLGRHARPGHILFFLAMVRF